MAHPSSTKVLHVVKKGPWSQVEDDMLIHLVARYGPEQWMEISKDHGSRNAKQCRERYHQNLKPTINRGPITAEEGVAIERLHAEKGPKWAEISRALGGRSDNQVKNWYNGQKNRRTKMHTHGGHQVALHGIQHSLSAVKPVDAQILHQRGHMNPYSQSSASHYHQCKPSPTTSQISEAPSLISDASSMSPGISPSSIIAYPTCASAWPLPDEHNRLILPSLHHLPSLLPLNDTAADLSRQPPGSQTAPKVPWQQKKPSPAQNSDLFSLRQNHKNHETQSHFANFQSSDRTKSVTDHLPPLQSLLSTQPSKISEITRTPDAPTFAQSSPRSARITLPRLRPDPGGELFPRPVKPCSRAAPIRFARVGFRHEPYPSSKSQATPHNTTKCRMDLANVLG